MKNTRGRSSEQRSDSAAAQELSPGGRCRQQQQQAEVGCWQPSRELDCRPAVFNSRS